MKLSISFVRSHGISYFFMPWQSYVSFVQLFILFTDFLLWVFLYLQTIDVLRFEMASEEEKTSYVALYTYFYTRKRIGVVGNCHSGVKDMYVVPIASHDPVPPELKPFDGPGEILNLLM